MPETVTPEPVFVDPAGRRMRWIRRTLWVLVVVAAAYVALAISAFLGGPTIDAPLLPQPPAAVAPPEPTPAAKTADAVPADPSTAPVDQDGTSGTDAGTMSDPSPASVPAPTAAPVPSQAPAPAPTETAPGSSGTAPGQTRSGDTPGDTHRSDPTPKPRAS